MEGVVAAGLKLRTHSTPVRVTSTGAVVMEDQGMCTRSSLMNPLDRVKAAGIPSEYCSTGGWGRERGGELREGEVGEGEQGGEGRGKGYGGGVCVALTVESDFEVVEDHVSAP